MTPEGHASDRDARRTHESIESINVAAVTGHTVKAMFHSTAMVADYDLAMDRLGALFGLRVLEYSAATDPTIARRGGMTWIGDGSIEIGEPIVDGAAPDRFVRRTGGGMQGLAVWVDDFETSVAQLAEMGVTMPVVVGHFGFSSPRTTFGLQLEWSGFTVPEDPRRRRAAARVDPHAVPRRDQPRVRRRGGRRSRHRCRAVWPTCSRRS